MQTLTENIPKDIPILLTVDMARAWNLGLKTNTRRLKGLEKVNLDPHNWDYKGTNFKGGHVFHPSWDPRPGEQHYASDCIELACPFGKPGDRLWPREPWRALKSWDHVKPSELPNFSPIDYLAGGMNVGGRKKLLNPGRYRSARFMCRWMSRNLSEIVSIRAERVQDISERDAIAEGVQIFRDIPDTDDTLTAKQLFFCLWDSINEKSGFGWTFNPWVWVIKFRKVK